MTHKKDVGNFKYAYIFPDTSEKSQQESRKSYRERAHQRKAKAAEKRARKAAKRKALFNRSVKVETETFNSDE